MAELKTKPTAQTVDQFLAKVSSESMRDDAYEIIKLMKSVTKEDPKMWGPSIIGFGSYHYKYESGHEGTMCMVGFSPRKPSIVLYVILGAEGNESQLKKLGKFKMGKSCIYIKKLADIDQKVLKDLMIKSIKATKKKYPG